MAGNGGTGPAGRPDSGGLARVPDSQAPRAPDPCCRCPEASPVCFQIDHESFDSNPSIRYLLDQLASLPACQLRTCGLRRAKSPDSGASVWLITTCTTNPLTT